MGAGRNTGECLHTYKEHRQTRITLMFARYFWSFEFLVIYLSLGVCFAFSVILVFEVLILICGMMSFGFLIWSFAVLLKICFLRLDKMKTEACSSQMCTFFMLPCIPVAVLRYCSSRLTRVSFLSVFSIYLLSYFLFYSVSCLLCLALTLTSSPVIILYLHPCFISLLLPVCPQVVYIHSLQTAFKCLILRA